MSRTAIIGVMALALAQLASPARAAEPAPYDIHVIQALTGGGAFLGNAENRALRIVETLVNQSGGIRGRPLRFIYHDDQSIPQVTVQIANELIALHPAVILGSSYVATCNAMAPLMANGPVMYCFAPGIRPSPGGYVFSTNTLTRDLATASIRYFRLKGWTRIAIMTSTDGSGQDAERSLKEVVALPENKDITIVENAHFNPADVSVSAQIERIKAANPQLLFAWSTGAPIATVFRAIQQAGLEVPVATTDGNMTYAQMTQFAAFLPKELYIHSSPWMVDGNPRIALDPAVVAKQKAFYAAFRGAGIEPDVASVLGWEPAMIVVEALRALGPEASATQLRDYLLHLKGFAGTSGVYDFERTPQRGLSIANAIVTRWDAAAGRWLPVSAPGGEPLER